MKMSELSVEEELEIFAEELKRFFTRDEIEQIARKTGFVKRKGKINAWQFVALCSFMDVDVAETPLVELASAISTDDGPTVSSQAIHKRFNERCVAFLKEIFNKLLNNKILSGTSVLSKIDNYFNRIIILDATSFQIPETHKDTYPGSGGNAQPAGMKVQLELELKSGNYIDLEVGAGSSDDSTFAKKSNATIGKGDLVIKDLGYFSIENFKEIDQKEAFYISRLKPNVSIYVDNSDIEYFGNGIPKIASLYKRIHIQDVMKEMNEGEIHELSDVYIGRETKLKTRLIIYKLTKEQLEKRRKDVAKKAKKKGVTKSKNTIELLEVSTYITNIKAETLTPNQVCEMYSLRWQVEIMFKIWKSLFHVQNVKKVKIERIECQLYGKLILLLLSSTIMCKMRFLLLLKKKKEASEIKLAEIIRQHIKSLYIKLMDAHTKSIVNILIKIFENLSKNGEKSHKKGRKTVFDILGVSYRNTKNVSAKTA
jgi:hypothetical protein